MYVFYSTDGINWDYDRNYEAIKAKSSPEKYTFSSHQYVRLGIVSVQTRNITSVELFYDCDYEPNPSAE